MSDKKMLNPEDLYEHLRIDVDPGQSPERIDKFLVAKMERTSRNRIQQAAKAGAISGQRSSDKG